MAEVPSNLKFLESHEWARLEEDGTVTVGTVSYTHLRAHETS